MYEFDVNIKIHTLRYNNKMFVPASTKNLLVASFKAITIFMILHLVNGCRTLHGEEREIMDARQLQNNQQNIANCFRKSLQKGNTRFAQSILDLYDQQYANLFISLYEKQLNRLKLINQQIILGESSCEPVVKWGQNYSHIFISLKMSHRWDSPPCLSTKYEQSVLTNQSFQYTHVCVVSNEKITFKVNLSLYYDVIGGNGEVKRDGVGTYSIIIEKKQSKVWPFLQKGQNAFSTWEEISERYLSVHRQYQSLLDSKMRQRRSKPVEIQDIKPSLPEEIQSIIPEPPTTENQEETPIMDTTNQL